MGFRLITCLFVSCLPSFAAHSFQLSDGNVRLEVQAMKSDAKLALCIIPNLLTNEPDTVAGKPIDANGNAIIDLKISKSTFIQIKVGRQTNTLLLEPHDNLRVLIDSSAGVSFGGRGEAASRYLAESGAILKKNEQVEGKHFLMLGPDKFIKHLAWLKHLYEVNNTTFFSENVVSQSTRHLLEARGNMQLLAYKLNYAMA